MHKDQRISNRQLRMWFELDGLEKVLMRHLNTNDIEDLETQILCERAQAALDAVIYRLGVDY